MYANIILRIIMYIFAIGLPIYIIVAENRGKNYSEIISELKVKFYLLFNDDKDAVNELIELVTKYPESYRGHRKLAEIYEKQGGMRKAIDEYVKAIDCKKDDYDAYYKVAFLLYDLGQKDESSTMLNTLLKNKPDDTKAAFLLGEILCEQEKFKEALNVYTLALKYDQNDYELYYSMGIAYTRLNDFQNAKTCYEKAAEINHEFYYAKYSLGQIALIYRDIETAEKYFTECIYSEDLEAMAYFELSKICVLKGEKDKAITFANKAIEIDITFKRKVDEEPILIPIKAYISIPQEGLREERKKLKDKYKINIDYLEKTYHVVENLNLKELGKQTELKKHQLEIDKFREE